jgi:hypothetical protein
LELETSSDVAARVTSGRIGWMSGGGSNCRDPETVSASGKMGWNEIEPIVSGGKNQNNSKSILRAPHHCVPGMSGLGRRRQARRHLGLTRQRTKSGQPVQRAINQHKTACLKYAEPRSQRPAIDRPDRYQTTFVDLFLRSYRLRETLYHPVAH